MVKRFFFKPQVNFYLPPKKIQNKHMGLVTLLVISVHPCACVLPRKWEGNRHKAVQHC